MVYRHHPQHRSAAFANKKSQWCITPPDETACYNLATLSGWIANGAYWGLHVLNGGVPAPSLLGTSPKNDNLFIAKFVSNQGVWHGYPVAHWLSPFDKPTMDVLNSWNAIGYINRAAKAKIHRGKKWTP